MAIQVSKGKVGHSWQFIMNRLREVPALMWMRYQINNESHAEHPEHNQQIADFRPSIHR
jgi:hypothetical protein